MTGDRQAEIAARAETARQLAVTGETSTAKGYLLRLASDDVPWLLAEIKQLTDRNAFLEASAEALACSAGGPKVLARYPGRPFARIHSWPMVTVREDELNALEARAAAAAAGIKQRDEALAALRLLHDLSYELIAAANGAISHPNQTGAKSRYDFARNPFTAAVDRARAALAGVGCTDTEPQGPEDGGHVLGDVSRSAGDSKATRLTALLDEVGRAHELLGEYGAGGAPAGLVPGIHNMASRAEKAEAEAARLVAALEEIANVIPERQDDPLYTVVVAREALWGKADAT